jgi:hypothetical protein
MASSGHCAICRCGSILGFVPFGCGQMETAGGRGGGGRGAVGCRCPIPIDDGLQMVIRIGDELLKLKLEKGGNWN